MYSNYEFLLLIRFLFSKKSDGYISIFSLFSIVGIMIGVAAIIIVMSVMNGFREELTNRLLGINGHINIYSTKGEINSILTNTIKSFESNSFKFFPIIETQGLITNEKKSLGVFLRSYEAQDLINKKIIQNNIKSGKIYSNNSNEIIVGYALADKLNIGIDSKVKLAIPKSDKTIFGSIPKFKTLIVSGIFNTGMYEYDSNFIFSSPNIARKLLSFERGSFTHIEIETDNPTTVDYSQKLLNDDLSTPGSAKSRKSNAPVTGKTTLLDIKNA